MREFCDNSLLSGCSQSNVIENNQAAINCMEITSFNGSCSLWGNDELIRGKRRE
jgi:hypothetical protein